MRSQSSLTMAVPKGRVLQQLAPVFAAAGIRTETLLASSRKLIRTDAATQTRFLLLKPDDVPTYVEYGAADMGIVGRDVLDEREYDLYHLLDLGIGRCRLVVAGKSDNPDILASWPHRHIAPLRVATKFPNMAQRYFSQAGLEVELIYVQGSVELAPLTGLADVIVDLVETGETLRANGLCELQTIGDISSYLVVNRAAMKLKRALVDPLVRKIQSLKE
jgi:ATP phosphoribosyltransferase